MHARVRDRLTRTDSIVSTAVCLPSAMLQCATFPMNIVYWCQGSGTIILVQKASFIQSAHYNLTQVERSAVNISI